MTSTWVHIGPSANAANEAQRAYLGRTARDTGAGTGAIDHIAFRATGLHAMLEHLRAQGVPLKQRRANGQALFQLFFFDPDGIKIELHYAAAEAHGIPGLDETNVGNAACPSTKG